MQGLKLKDVNDIKPEILLVDDEQFNLEILCELLEDEGYRVDTAENGAEAIKILDNNPDKYQTVLLDRMMPEMDGIHVLKYMKNNPRLVYIPVIMQTAKATKTDIQDGLDAGVLYYLTKPFDRPTLLAIVNTTISSFYSYASLRNELEQTEQKADVAILNHQAQFEFKNIDQARSLAILLASLCPQPDKVVIGLSELFVNAVEHGNLAIGYETKTRLYEDGNWLDEIDRRLKMDENKHKKVNVRVQYLSDQIQFHIQDQGAGFDYVKYFEVDPERAVNTHGRGIAIASTMCFDDVQYLGDGSEVIATIQLNKVGNNG